MMTPREYLTDFVMPNVMEYRADYGNLRRAMNAAASVHALPAHIFYCLDGAARPLGYKDDDRYRDALASVNADFKLLHEVAKGIKHVSLRYGKPDIAGAESLGVSPVGWGTMGYGEGQYGGPPQVTVVFKDGSERLFETALDQSIELLQSELLLHGL